MSAVGLPKYWRFYAYNDGNSESLGAGDITISFFLSKFDSQGAVSWSALQSESNPGSIADNNYGAASDIIDNSTNKYMGIDGRVTVDTGTGGGTVSIFLQCNAFDSADESDADWPGDDGILLAVVDTPAALVYYAMISF